MDVVWEHDESKGSEGISLAFFAIGGSQCFDVLQQQVVAAIGDCDGEEIDAAGDVVAAVGGHGVGREMMGFAALHPSYEGCGQVGLVVVMGEGGLLDFVDGFRCAARLGGGPGESSALATTRVHLRCNENRKSISAALGRIPCLLLDSETPAASIDHSFPRHHSG